MPSFFDFLLLCDHYAFHRIASKGGIRLRVTARNPIDHIHALNNLSENGVTAVQLFSWSKSNKELTAIRIRSGICHGDNTCLVKLQIAILVDKFITRSARTSPRWVTTLCHKTIQYTMERHTIKESLASPKYKTINGYWRLIMIKLNDALVTPRHFHSCRLLICAIDLQPWHSTIMRTRRNIGKHFAGRLLTNRLRRSNSIW